jgi:AhpD family alkylhydroperoxidase
MSIERWAKEESANSVSQYTRCPRCVSRHGAPQDQAGANGYHGGKHWRGYRVNGSEQAE